MWAMSLFFHEYTSDKFLFHLVSPHICVDSDTIFWWWIEDQSSLPIFVPFCVEYQFYAIGPGEEVQMGSCLLFTGFWWRLLLPYWGCICLLCPGVPLLRVSISCPGLCDVSWCYVWIFDIFPFLLCLDGAFHVEGVPYLQRPYVFIMMSLYVAPVTGYWEVLERVVCCCDES